MARGLRRFRAGGTGVGGLTVPQEVHALLALAHRLIATGEPGAAQALGEAIALGPEGRAMAAPVLAGLLENFVPRRRSERLERDLLACLEEPAVDPQRLARVTAAALLLRGEGDAAELGAAPLWVAFLSRCINVNPAMEARLIRARRALLGQGAAASADAVCAVALQAFAGEYAWAVEPGEGDAPALAVAAAMYRPLPEGISVPGRLGALLEQAMREEPLAERAMAQGILVLGGETEQGISAAVRAHYEANPYPRWRTAPASPPADLRAGIGGLPGVDAAALPEGPLEVLMAGCGTGYEAVDIARTDPTLRITAIDLSAASLSYAKRMADGLGISNISFVRGDILSLFPGEGRGPVEIGSTLDPGLRRGTGPFDLIVSTGVLHHLESPAEGLAALAAVLRPGGVIRLGLYSARARALVAQAHELIAERGWRADAAGIRAFRAHILSLPDSDPLAGLRGSDDFYSLSGCRDLFFHACEHWFTPPEIGALVAGAGLRLAAFDAPGEGWEAFEAMHGRGADPLDLALWDAVEQRHPELFAGMYQFWCQKPGAMALP